MPSKAVVFVLTSFLTVVLICSLASTSYARINSGPIICLKMGYQTTIDKVGCCQKQTDNQGIEINYCTICADTHPPSNCGPRFTIRGSSVNTTGVLAPLGPNAPTTNNNSGTQPGS